MTDIPEMSVAWNVEMAEKLERLARSHREAIARKTGVPFRDDDHATACVIRDRLGVEYPSLLRALKTIRTVDKTTEHMPLVEEDLPRLRADLDAIIASAEASAADARRAA